MYSLKVKQTFTDCSNLFALEDDYKDDRPISLNTFITRVMKDLDCWNIRIQIHQHSNRLYCNIKQGDIVDDYLGVATALPIKNIVKITGCVIDKTCIITLSLNGDITDIYSRLCDCIGSSNYDAVDLQRIRNYIRQLPFIKYSFGLLKDVFLTDLEAIVGNMEYIRKEYINHYTFTLESVNKDILSNDNLRVCIDAILTLHNYRNIFESNVKLTNGKEVFVITLKLP
nr:MAG TPA: hypothetical protein [Crassvirales sp.]